MSGEKKKTLNVFDIDDCLLHSVSNIGVLKHNKIIKTLTNREFNNYKLGNGESYDFSELRNAHNFRNTARPVQNMLDLATRIVYNKSNQSETILLTARSDFDNRDVFLETFRDHGFPIDHVYVERAGNLGRFNPKVTANITKLVVLRKYIKSGKFARIRVFDDSEKNLRSILKLVKLHPELIVDAYLVHSDGTFEKYFMELI